MVFLQPDMIIQLSKQFDQILSGEISALSFEILERLIQCHVDRKHLFLPSKFVIDVYLNSSDRFSARQIAAVCDIKENYPTYSGLASSVHTTLLLKPEGEVLQKEELNQNFVVSIADVINSNILEKSVLIVEDASTDGEYLFQIIRCIAAREKLPRIFDVDLVHGGGGRTPRQIDRILASNRLFYCVVDSDIETPFCDLGGTASSVKSKLEEFGLFLGDLKILSLHELENTIPLSVGKEVYSSDPEICGQIDALDRLRNAKVSMFGQSYHDLLSRFDMKNGIDIDKLEGVNKEKTEYLKKVWHLVFPEERDLDPEDVLRNKLVYGVSSKFLENTIAWLEYPANQNLFSSRIKKENYYEEILDISKVLISFGITSPDLRAI